MTDRELQDIKKLIAEAKVAKAEREAREEEGQIIRARHDL
tara:strand:- start:1428 stop:1547 length:120 start_codon:yes stop_codon:yes gene_type:complete